MTHRRHTREGTRRRGAVAVLVLVMLTTIMGFAALTIDVGMMYNTRADLQRAADAAALAGASSLVSDSMMLVRTGDDDGGEMTNVTAMTNSRAAAVASVNASFGTSATLINAGDIRVGWLDLNSATATLQPNPAPPLYPNAVEVTVRRSFASGNGPVSLMFASVYGPAATEIVATATAVFDDRVASIAVGGDGFLPFTIHEDVYEDHLVNGDDSFGWDDGIAEVTSGPDNIPEINLYPHDVAPGNFGLLNVPSTSPASSAEIKDQIDNGMQPEDVEIDIGGTEFIFEDDWGNPITYELNGTPGLSVTLKANIELRVGDVVGFLLHDGADGVGDNLDYHITGIRFGRVMGVKLTGPEAGMGLWIQPAIYNGPTVRIVPGAKSSGNVGRLVLAR